MKPNWLAEGLADAAARGAAFGESNFGQGERVNIEFVSANPTLVALRFNIFLNRAVVAHSVNQRRLVKRYDNVIGLVVIK